MQSKVEIEEEIYLAMIETCILKKTLRGRSVHRVNMGCQSYLGTVSSAGRSKYHEGFSTLGQTSIEFTGSELHVSEIADEWIKSRPDAAQNASINEVLDRVYTIKVEKDVVRLVREPFYADYSAKHDGALPAVDPANTNRWDFADQTPDSELVAAETNRTMFRDWLQSELLTPDDETCSSAIIIYATVLADPVPRNVYLDPPKVNPKFSLSRIAPFAEVLDFAIPVGEFEANSTITNHTQKLPLGLGIMAAKGCDGVLTRLAQDMAKSGIIGQYNAGGTLEGGEVLFK
ncbi:hypothetical protein GGI35DRAFT_485531 [Trichoderma velutinum]